MLHDAVTDVCIRAQQSVPNLMRQYVTQNPACTDVAYLGQVIDTPREEIEEACRFSGSTGHRKSECLEL